MGDQGGYQWPLASSMLNRSTTTTNLSHNHNHIPSGSLTNSGAGSASVSVAPSPAPPATLAHVKPSVYKSRLCVFHAAGRCSHGSACSFAHSAYELSDPKTVICPKFEQFGFCDDLAFTSPSSCPFAHDPAELRQLPKVVKTALCRYFPQGRCKAGTACRHAHAIDEIDAAYLPSLYTPETASLTSLYLSMPNANGANGSSGSGNGGSHSNLTTPSPMPSPLGSPRLMSGNPATLHLHAALQQVLPPPASASLGAAASPLSDQPQPELDLQSLQASLLALALELERLRNTNGR